MHESRPGEHGDAAELKRLREQVRHLRARPTSHPLIAQARGMLRERYAPRDAESAFALLQRASQLYNVKLRALGTGGRRQRGGLWYDRTVVVDALEYLHALGRAHTGGRFRRS